MYENIAFNLRHVLGAALGINFKDNRTDMNWIYFWGRVCVGGGGQCLSVGYDEKRSNDYSRIRMTPELIKKMRQHAKFVRNDSRVPALGVDEDERLMLRGVRTETEFLDVEYERLDEKKPAIISPNAIRERIINQTLMESKSVPQGKMQFKAGLLKTLQEINKAVANHADNADILIEEVPPPAHVQGGQKILMARYPYHSDFVTFLSGSENRLRLNTDNKEGERIMEWLHHV